jgi:hypothetical protein
LRAALHHETGAALGYVREHSFAPMQTDRLAQIHGEHEVHDGSGRQAQGLDLEENTHGGKIFRATTVKLTARHREVYGGRDLVSFQQTPFHPLNLFLFFCPGTPSGCCRGSLEIKPYLTSRQAFSNAVSTRAIMSRAARRQATLPGHNK